MGATGPLFVCCVLAMRWAVQESRIFYSDIRYSLCSTFLALVSLSWPFSYS